MLKFKGRLFAGNGNEPKPTKPPTRPGDGETPTDPEPTA